MMANALNRDIQPGEVLVLRKGVVLDAYHKLEDRLFIAQSGFGMSASTSGGKIIGENARFENGKLVREGRASYLGHHFSVRDTKAWQKEHGRFAPADVAGQS